jgi:hypothetical protein
MNYVGVRVERLVPEQERFLPVPCHSLARCILTTGRRTDKGLWETEHLRSRHSEIARTRLSPS